MPESLLLLDTDIVSLAGRQRPPPGLRPWLLEVGIHRLILSFPTITELLRGAHLKREKDPEKAAQIDEWVRNILALPFPSIPMSPAVADLYAHMTSVPAMKHLWTIQRAQRSNRLGHDLMLASISIAYGLPILTANVSDFLRIHERFPLPGVFQPMQAQWHVPPLVDVPLPPFDCGAGEIPAVRLPAIEHSGPTTPTFN